MMANIAYVPVEDVSKIVPIIEQTQIPPYDDQGISFKGFSKQLITGNQYKLRPQTRRTYLGLDTRAGAGTYLTITRSNASTTNFYCTDLTVNINAVPGVGKAILINRINSLFDWVLWIEPIAGHVTFHFSAPMLFEGNIFYANVTGAAGESVSFTFNGWEEEK